MQENVETQIVFSGDASQLQSAFEQLVNEISRTREELKQYKNDKEKTAELTQKLADQELELVRVMKQNNNEIDASQVSYKQLNDILKDLNKTYKATADEAQRLDLAPSMNAINQELKGMDASIGNFQRNVGNYEGAVDKASKNLAQSFRQIGQTLPSLLESPEKFFMALAQSIPNLVEAYRSIQTAQKAAAATTEKQVELDKMELANKSALAKEQTALSAAKVTSAGASLAEKDSSLALKDAEILETKETMNAMKADIDAIVVSKNAVKALIEQQKTTVALAEAEAARTGNLEKYKAEYQTLITLMKQLEAVTLQEKQSREALLLTEERYEQLVRERVASTSAKAGAAMGAASADVAAAGAAETLAGAEETATVATKGLGAALSSFLLIATVVVSLIAIFGKDILKWAKNLSIFNDEAKKAARFQKEWNQYMREGHQNAAKQIVDLQIYAKWAAMTTKTDKERTIAAKELLKAMGSAVTETNILKVKNADLSKETDAVRVSVEELTKALIKQAQAEAMTSKITERYKEVIDAMEEYADAQARQQRNELDAIGAAQMAGRNISTGGMAPGVQDMGKAMGDALQGSVDRAKKTLEEVKDDFNQWLEKFLQEFNPSDLLSGKNGGSGGKGDNWFSKWELYIKEYEATLKKFQGEYEELDFSSIWKYSAEGLVYYTKMYDEYIEHYKKDEKAFREAKVNKAKYLNEFNEYHLKLQKQYLDSLKTEKQVEIDQLEEWYTVQKAIYKNAGEDTAGLEAEYTKRKEDILNKYIDKYKNALLERKALDLATTSSITEYNKAMMDLELANLEDTFKKELKEYERKGIETTNLVEHYAQESEKIVSKYAAEETKAVIDNLKKQEDYRKRMNEVQYGWSQTDNNSRTERTMASLGGTVMTGHKQRQNDINATFNEFNIWKESAEAQIAAMQEVLDTGKLVGQEKLEMEAAVADAEKELYLGVAEYQLQLNQMTLEDARETTQGFLSNLQSGVEGIGGAFDDIYTAIEKTMEARVAEGKLTNEEAEKQLQEYRGIKAAAATMDALGSAVGAYNSLASIPYVGPALGIAAAAAALAAGMANVRLILATTKDNAGNGTDNYANAAPSLSDYTPQYVTNVTGKDDTDYLANALSEKPIQAFVVESDVTAAQEVANKRTNETTW